MKIAVYIVSALLALSAGGAQARGIDCSRTTTKLEGQICSDPEMLEYEKRIAMAHAHALTVWNGTIAAYVRSDQQQWLTGFRSMERLEAAIESDCVLTDRACVRAELRRRVDDVESGAYIHSGVYRAANGMKLLLHPGRANGYRVRLYDPARSAVNIMTADGERAALWDGPQDMVSVMGDSDGVPLPQEDGCTLRLLPQPLAIRVVQSGSCGGHRYDERYDRLLDETLRGYELELH